MGFTSIGMYLGQEQCLGALGGVVQLLPDHRHFVGGDVANSATGELIALVWSMLWAIQYATSRLPEQLRFCFHYDSKYAGGAAFFFNNSIRSSGLVTIITSLWQYLRDIADVTHGHIHSHKGHPWNELADKVCLWMSKSSGQHPASIDTLNQEVVNPVREWAAEDPRESGWAFLFSLDQASGVSIRKL